MKSPVVILYDASGNPVTVSQDGAVYRLAIRAKLDADGAKQKVYLVDSVNEVELAVAANTTLPANTRALILAGIDESNKAQFAAMEGDGILKVSTRPPQPPLGVSQTVVASYSPLPITSDSETVHTITSGKTFYIQQVAAGAEGDPSEKGSRIDILYRVNTTDYLIDYIYVHGASVAINYPDTYKTVDNVSLEGDGSTKKIVVKRHRLSGASQEVFAVLRGYEK